LENPIKGSLSANAKADNLPFLFDLTTRLSILRSLSKIGAAKHNHSNTPQRDALRRDSADTQKGAITAADTFYNRHAVDRFFKVLRVDFFFVALIFYLFVLAKGRKPP
jgi:hypothetical protein